MSQRKGGRWQNEREWPGSIEQWKLKTTLHALPSLGLPVAASWLWHSFIGHLNKLLSNGRLLLAGQGFDWKLSVSCRHAVSLPTSLRLSLSNNIQSIQPQLYCQLWILCLGTSPKWNNKMQSVSVEASSALLTLRTDFCYSVAVCSTGLCLDWLSC